MSPRSLRKPVLVGLHDFGDFAHMFLKIARKLGLEDVPRSFALSGFKCELSPSCCKPGATGVSLSFAHSGFIGELSSTCYKPGVTGVSLSFAHSGVNCELSSSCCK